MRMRHEKARTADLYGCRIEGCRVAIFVSRGDVRCPCCDASGDLLRPSLEEDDVRRAALRAARTDTSEAGDRQEVGT